MTDLKQLGTTLSQGEFSLSETAWRSVAREAIKGIDKAGQPKDKKEILDATFGGIKAYYSTWSDSFIKRLAEAFVDEYLK